MGHMGEEHSSQWNSNYKDPKAKRVDLFEEGPRHRRKQVMEALGKEFYFKSSGQPLDDQYFRSLGKERTLGIQGLRADFRLGLEGSNRVGRAQHKEKAT